MIDSWDCQLGIFAGPEGGNGDASSIVQYILDQANYSQFKIRLGLSLFKLYILL